MTDTISVTAARLDTHEAVCAQRYSQITERLDKGAERMDKMQYLIYVCLRQSCSALELLRSSLRS